MRYIVEAEDGKYFSFALKDKALDRLCLQPQSNMWKHSLKEALKFWNFIKEYRAGLRRDTYRKPNLTGDN